MNKPDCASACDTDVPDSVFDYEGCGLADDGYTYELDIPEPANDGNLPKN
ncbi:MAG: hypothetical protein WC551_02885 [Patescibacteria group bacterium]